MSFSGWLVAISVLIILIGLALGIGWWYRNLTNTGIPISPQITPSVWASPVPGPNPEKNICQVYTFPTIVTQTAGPIPANTVIPGVPTLNSNVLDNLDGSTNRVVCIDSDQIGARQVTHYCSAPTGTTEVNPNLTMCRLLNGGYTGLGGSETFYTSCPNGGYSLCAGSVSTVAVNFQSPAQPNINCIQSEGPEVTVSVAPCDPSNQAQLFRVTRIEVGQNPFTLNPGQGQNGPIAQILDRSTGLCLNPGTSITTTTYQQSYLNPVGCLGNYTEDITGTDVVLTTCQDGQYPGYVWLLLPSYPYCSDPLNCQNGIYTVTPPQIVYIGKLDIASAPTGGQSYAGLTGPSALIRWLTDNDAQSSYFGGSGNLILNTIATDSGGTSIPQCIQKATTSQYLNLTTYNILSQEQVCVQQGNFGTIQCPIF